MTNLKGQLNVGEDEEGRPAAVYTPSEDEIAMLMTLQANPAFQIYQKILRQAKEGFFHMTMAMEDTNKVMKTIGMVVGINYSINQLNAMILMGEAALAKKEAAKAKIPKE